MATCLYKDKPCSICGKTIKVGEECAYEPQTKGVHHFECEKNQPPGPKAFALAEKLGYREYGWEELLKVIDQSEQENPCSTNSTKQPN